MIYPVGGIVGSGLFVLPGGDSPGTEDGQPAGGREQNGLGWLQEQAVAQTAPVHPAAGRYRCREWARYGKAVEATTVHHVWPAEEYPEYAWAPWNLVSLSGDRHDAMHDRRTGRLTELGEAWRRRIAPPPSEPY